MLHNFWWLVQKWVKKSNAKKKIYKWFFSNNLLPVDPCLQNFTTEVTLPEHQLGLLSAAPGQYKAREGQDWVVKYLQLVHDTWNEVVKVIIINGVHTILVFGHFWQQSYKSTKIYIL